MAALSLSTDLPAIVGLALVLGAFLFARRFGGSTALEELERANRILSRRVDELERINREQANEVVLLRSRTDIAKALEPLSTLLTAQHGEAMSRFGHMETLLGMIAARLGPDPDAE